MEEHSIIMVVIVFACVIMSAYFSATETAFSTLNKIRIKTMAEDGNRRAQRVYKLTENFDALLSTILIGNNIVNILASSLSTILFIGWIKGNESLATTLSTIVLTIVILIFGEISPKSIAKESSEKFAMFAAPIISFLMVIFTPLNFLFKQWKKLLSKLFKADEDTGITEEELISIIEEAEEDGNLEKNETELIRSAIEFNELEVGDIFTPRIDITAVKKEAEFEEIREVFKTSGYSRIPVYVDDLDNIVGILYYKDFFTKDFDNIESIIKPVMFVTKTRNVNELMNELQEKKLHLAVVTDEYGSTAGIVTLEDILEEIVGDIWDEHDNVEIEIREVGENKYILSGKASISKVFDELDIDNETESLTVNGWAMDALGRIPVAGDQFEADGLQAKVLKMNGRRIDNLMVIKLEPEEDDEEKED
ncbi:MAG: HlyC/CorC family transporter [Ruminococcaceae bacterium]|nr:HlyC/CorC family transporter [Oscillospiraceae bacterium]